MQFFLQVSHLRYKTQKPKIIFHGRCKGILVFISGKKEADIFTNSIVKEISKKAFKNFIFLCEFPKRYLNSLLPFAKGIIFKDGSNLSHLANNLRQHCIPSCIDDSLWHKAQKLLNESQEITALLNCGKEIKYSQQTKSEYKKRLNYYYNYIQTKSINIPIFDIQRMEFVHGNKPDIISIGMKALSVNSLFLENFLVPDTILFSNFGNLTISEDIINSIIKTIRKSFPEIETDSDYTLMIRYSIAHNLENIKALSGILPTASVKSLQNAKEVIMDISKKWTEIRKVHKQLSFNILVQKRIPAILFGVLFTSLPWNYHSNSLIFNLRTGNPLEEYSSNIHACIDIPQINEKDKLITSINDQLSEQLNVIIPKKLKRELFYSAFSVFICKCLGLSEKCKVPLDIEFAVSEDYTVYFTQFRHIHFM